MTIEGEFDNNPTMKGTTSTFRLSVAAVVLAAATVHAQSNPGETSLRPPAVAEVNGKLGYAGGNMNSAEGHNFDGSLTFPVADAFGFQADALYSRIGGLDFYGGAGHLFWRNPDLGLIGVAGGYLHRSGVNTFQIGAEAEYYLDCFTFGIFAGVGSIHYDNAAPFIDTSPTRFVGRISADWYPVDDLRVGVSYTTAFRNNLVKGEAEYQTPLRGLALTAEGAVGDHGYDHWLLGVRYYFGGNKTLRERHRSDDPRSLMPQIVHGMGVYGAEFNRKGRAYLAADPGAGSLNGGGSYGSSSMMNLIGSGGTWVELPFDPGRVVDDESTPGVESPEQRPRLQGPRQLPEDRRTKPRPRD